MVLNLGGGYVFQTTTLMALRKALIEIGKSQPEKLEALENEILREAKLMVDQAIDAKLEPTTALTPVLAIKGYFREARQDILATS